ncbi:hypothetical protein CRG98_047935, partial [Punica granatum]
NWNSDRGEHDPANEIEKLALVSGNLEIGEFGEPSPEDRKNPSVRPRSTTAECRRCPELPPASIPAVVAASRGENRRPQPRRRRCPDPGRPLANGPRPSSFFFSQAQPKPS